MRPDTVRLSRIRQRLRLGLVAGLFGVGLMSADAISALAERGQQLWAATVPPESSAQLQRWIEQSRQAGAPAVEGGAESPLTPTIAASAPVTAPTASSRAVPTPTQPLSRELVTARSANRKAASSGNRWHYGSFPVENFQSYTSGFGYRRGATGGSRWEFHRGLDLAAPKGSYIRNWWAGRVAKVSSDRLCGTSIVVQSGKWQHVYCHMEGSIATENGQRYLDDRAGGIRLREGQEVATGTRIGRVGMTGRTTGPHLHWGVKYDKDWIDPGLILRAMYDQQGSP